MPSFLLRTGCRWRFLPADFPPWQTVYYYFRRFRLDGYGVASSPPFAGRSGCA